MKQITLNLIRCLLVVLYSYVAFSKWFAFRQFLYDTHNQPFPRWLGDVLIVLIPFLEFFTALFLVFPSLLVWGFRLSTILMTLFTLYVSAVLLGWFHRVPCPCGGFLSGLDWGQHLIMNIFLLLLSLTGLILIKSSNKKYMHA